MQTEFQKLVVTVQELRTETTELRGQVAELTQKLQEMDKTHKAGASVGSSADEPGQKSDQKGTQAEESTPTLETLQEQQQLLEGKLAEQYQTKVESASKRRVRLFGIVLMNLFSNQGNVDHIETPSVALPANAGSLGGETAGSFGAPGGSFGATLRQSQFGVEVYGPTVAGAKTQGYFVADFFGAFPEINNGAAGGSLRVRTGTIRFDWSHTSVLAGLDNLFFSPAYATSYASLGIPAFAYSGDIWGWVPQVRVEHELIATNQSKFTISGGILDPLTGEAPPNDFLRAPSAGESRRQPAYASRLEWRRRISGQELIIGAGGYYSLQNWVGHNVDGWAATTDWNVRVGRNFSLSGKFYSGRAIGGLGAGLGNSILANGPLTNPPVAVRALRSIGGWSQLKFKPTTKLEFNASAGQDDANADDVRGFTVAPGYLGPNLTRNRSELGNVIYRPRSDLLFSAEFRTWRSFAIDGTSQRANQLNLIMGIIF